MKFNKNLIGIFAVLALLLMVSIPGGLAFARSQAISPTTFFACEDASTGVIDSFSITQQDTLNCADGNHQTFSTTVQWSVTGPTGPIGPKGDTGPQGPIGLTGDTGPAGQNGTDGTNGTDGLPGAQGPAGPIGLTGMQGLQGPAGPSGLPFSHAACSETQTGSAQQENLVFCQSGIEADGGTIYIAAIAAAGHRIIVGTPISSNASVDWGNTPITYVEFTSGLHAEYHADNVVRFYNAANQQVFQA